MSGPLHSKNLPSDSDPTILLALDGSPLAERALPTALELAARFEAALHLLVVVDGTSRHNWEERAKAEQQPVDASVAGYLSVVAADPRLTGVEVSWSAVFGLDTVKEITKTARESNARLIVVGTHGRTGVRRALMGSIAEQLLRSSATPVVVVPVQRLAE